MKCLIDIIKKSNNFTYLADRIAAGNTADVSGVTPSFKPYLLAALATLPARGVLWITSSWDGCEKLYEAAYPFFPDNLKERFQAFPEFSETGDADLTPSLRMKALELLAQGKPAYFVAPYRSILQACEEPGQLKNDSIVFKKESEISLDSVIEKLDNLGYSRNYQVEKRGEYSRRGGILDIYPSTAEPIRVEFFGDYIDSIRTFDLNSQVSTGKLDEAAIYPEREYKREKKLLDFLPDSFVIVIDDPDVIKFHAIERNFEEDRDLWGEFEYEIRNRAPVKILSWSGEKGIGITYNTRPLDTFGGDLEKLFSNIQKWQDSDEIVAISTQHSNRFKGLLKERGFDGVITDHNKSIKPGKILLIPGDITTGFLWEDEKLRLVTDKEILGAVPRRKRVLRTWDRNKAVNLAELKPGDRVVHLSHGIGRFVRLAHLVIQGTKRDFVELEYQKGDKLFVPVEQMDLLQKYIGPETAFPNLSKLGGTEWTKTKNKVKEAAEKIAAELLDLYAGREQTLGFAYSPDTPWQWELEASFPFEETPDQDKAIDAVKHDLELPRPMDRLLCGDAGYGKTEVALRAAFKATQDGKQVALLTPTTILAAQHYDTFKKRLRPFPVEVAMLSRFKTAKEQRETVRKLENKEVDVVVGTHRLLQKDIKFKDLGLIIVDEEQHFGVKDKEKLKKLKLNVDVLTMTATPIPRTMYMSLSGIRDLSVIETAPEDRLPVKTNLYEYNSDVIRAAIIRELERGGQVYFVHNRVHDIERVARDIREMVPFAKVGVGHGQMDEHELELLMLDFYDGNFDVLVCTTIIESGLDIPNANTIIVNNAQNFGLSQLYQLRGRVGRSNHQAYAYLLYPAHRTLTEDAMRRLEVIRDFSHLGAGFQIAMKDLEIRGAGNILGAEQSGYIAAIGFDLYCQMLKDAIEEKRGVSQERRIESPVIDLPVDAFIPDTYIADSQVKLEMYRKIARIDKIEDIEKIVEELKDRFGKIPISTNHLLSILKIKILACDLGTPSVKELQEKLQIILPGVQKLTMKQIQEIFEKTGVRTYFYKSILTAENIFGKKKQVLGASEKEPPTVWMPKIEKLLLTLVDMKKGKKI